MFNHALGEAALREGLCWERQIPRTNPWCSLTQQPYFSSLAAAVGLLLDQMGNT